MASPLTENDLQNINTNLTNLKVALEEIKKAEQAGIDVSDLRDQAKTQEAQLLKLKQSYFPGR